DMFDESKSGSTLQMPRRRLSTSFEAKNINEESAKIVEMDTYGRPKSSRSRRTNSWASNPCDDDSFEPPMLSSRASDWAQQHQHSKLSTTAQSTPRFANNSCGSNTPVTPIAEGVCVDSYYFRNNYYDNNYPNYMALKHNHLSGITMQRSCSQAQDKINFKNAIIDKIENSREFTH
ncbi:uncharacterized protein LOC124892094, partial [Capsicum annuum]|uniref:uncharacterized protein LOC124892094 n=1 Tax=Capsicum annuum TaxID=4072 RepID=UPI001FB0DC01